MKKNFCEVCEQLELALLSQEEGEAERYGGPRESPRLSFPA